MLQNANEKSSRALQGWHTQDDPDIRCSQTSETESKRKARGDDEERSQAARTPTRQDPSNGNVPQWHIIQIWMGLTLWWYFCHHSAPGARVPRDVGQCGQRSVSNIEYIIASALPLPPLLKHMTSSSRVPVDHAP